MRLKYVISLLAGGILYGPALQAQELSGLEIEAKATELLGKMTLEEKIGMIHGNTTFTSGGVPRLGIRDFVMSDGPHGVRPSKTEKDSATYLPVAITLASTWNRKLGYDYGAVLGSEASYRGKDVILGPGINIHRTPLNGRNFEYMSEDPFFNSQMVVGYIKGVQDQGISACVKHFIANNQETGRDSINVLMSERALREIYLPGFKAAVMQAGVNTIMGAYNRFRGEFGTYNDYLVNTILKGEWGFKGIMISDWGALHTTRDALLGGADLEMGTKEGSVNNNQDDYYFGKPALRLVKSGEISETIIDQKVIRILKIMLRTNVIGGKRKPGSLDLKAHAAVAREVAREGIILLKNTGILPLEKQAIKTIAVIGANATRPNAMGGGSSKVRPPYEITPLKGLQGLIENTTAISFSQGYTISKGAKADSELISQAVENAKRSQVAIVVGGWTHGYDYSKWSDIAYDSEGTDKPDMNMPFGQDELISAVIEANPNTIVVLFGGGPIDISKWEKKAKAILQVGYPGEDGGTALAEILLGQVNPSGKLTFSWPEKLSDSPAHKLGEYPGNGATVHYKDDLFVGYRYFDTYGVKPLFPFGHGLSYTQFEYGKLKTNISNGVVRVILDIKNTGNREGSEVVQLYVKDNKSSVKRPRKELKGFEKLLSLQPGQSKEVEFTLDKEAFSFFDEKSMGWVLEPGSFDLLAGASSSDIRSKASIRL